MYIVWVLVKDMALRPAMIQALQTDGEFEIVDEPDIEWPHAAAGTPRWPDMLVLESVKQLEWLGVLPEYSLPVIISDQRDTESLQQAMHLGAAEYLLKPVEEEELRQIFAQLKSRLQVRKQTHGYLDWVNRQIHRHQFQLAEWFLADCIRGQIESSDIRNGIRYLELPLQEPYCLTVVRMRIDKGGIASGQEWDETLLYYSAKNLMLEAFDRWNPVSVCRSGDNLVLLCSCADQEALFKAGIQLHKMLEETLPVQVGVAQATGEDVTKIAEVYYHMMIESESDGKYSHLVSLARRYVEDRYMLDSLTMKDTARYLHISPQHLSRVFRQETGITFMDYLTRVRLGHARELLAGSALKIYEVAERTGYSNQHYFSNAFKKATGMSPLEYRRKKSTAVLSEEPHIA